MKNSPKKASGIKRDIDLLYEIGTLRFVDRTWKQFFGPAVANVAEHHYRVLWIALTIAAHEKKGSHEKLLKMAMAHDVSEARTGDVHYLSRQYVIRHEDKAVVDIFEHTAMGEEFVALLREYEKRESIESRILKDADNIDVDLELHELARRGQSALPALWKNHRRDHVYTRLYTDTAKKFWKAIHDSHSPDLWHIESSSNRFNGGDWKNKKKPRK
jgi:putative hydrolases of HD superfamily